MGGDEGRQKGVAEAEQLLEEFPLHGVDPLSVLSGLLHEVPQGLGLILGLEGGLLRCDDHGEGPWGRSHRMRRNRCSAQGGSLFPSPAVTTHYRQTKSRRAGGGSRPNQIRSPEHPCEELSPRFECADLHASRPNVKNSRRRTLTLIHFRKRLTGEV